MSNWKKVVVSGSFISQLNNDKNYLTSGTTTITTGQSSAIVDNTAKVGITTGQSSAIVDNTAKTGITTGQSSAIVDNTAKTSFPGFVDSALTGATTAANLTISGDLVVDGTASFQNSDTLLVKDSIILLGSGSSAGSKDGGTVVYQSGNSPDEFKGNFLGYQANAGEANAGGRYGVAADIEADASAVTLTEFLSTVKVAASSPTGDGDVAGEKPAFGGTGGFGSIWVNSSANEAYIYV